MMALERRTKIVLAVCGVAVLVVFVAIMEWRDARRKDREAAPTLIAVSQARARAAWCLPDNGALAKLDALIPRASKETGYTQEELWNVVPAASKQAFEGLDWYRFCSNPRSADWALIMHEIIKVAEQTPRLRNKEW